MIAYILIVISTAGCGTNCTARNWAVVTMQRFADAKACQFASLELAKRAKGRFEFVCVPEATK